MKKTVYKMELDSFQEMAETYKGRELTKKELKRLNYIFYDEGTFYLQVYGAFQDALSMAMDKNRDWKKWDESVKDTSLARMFDWNEDSEK